MIIHIASGGTKHSFIFGQTVYGKNEVNNEVNKQPPTTVIEYVDGTNTVRLRSEEENMDHLKPHAVRLPYDIGAEVYQQRKHYSENPYTESDW